MLTPSSMPCFHSLDALRAWRNTLPPSQKVAFVPTMGNLHAGHLALVKAAQAVAEVVVVSIFVNPTQFGPNEDFDRYPRTLAADLQHCEAAGVTAVFAPSVEVLYPLGAAEELAFQLPASLTQRHCGLSRAGHFEGVAQVVLKLFNAVQPHIAVFGEKDAQQVAVIRHLIAALLLPITLLEAPVVRDADGLALSSRNQYLASAEERAVALLLPRTLQQMAQQVRASSQPLPLAATFEAAKVATEALSWEYCDAVQAESFQPTESLTVGVRLLAAARIGSLRLLDTLLI